MRRYSLALSLMLFATAAPAQSGWPGAKSSRPGYSRMGCAVIKREVVLPGPGLIVWIICRASAWHVVRRSGGRAAVEACVETSALSHVE